MAKQNDITSEGRVTRTREMARDLNTVVDLEVNANSMANVMLPTPGKLILGDRGLDFRTNSGIGYVQIPWSTIEHVTVDIPFKEHVRAITVATDECAPLEFVISDGADVIRCIAKHIGRDKLSQGRENFKAAGHFIKDKVQGLFHKKDKQ